MYGTLHGLVMSDIVQNCIYLVIKMYFGPEICRKINWNKIIRKWIPMKFLVFIIVIVLFKRQLNKLSSDTKLLKIGTAMFENIYFLYI